MLISPWSPRMVSVLVIAMIAQVSPSFAADTPVAFLVRARVEKVEGVVKGLSGIATLVVVHQYAGTGDVLGRRFTDKFQEFDLRGKLTSIPFEVDQEGIWVLQEFKGSMTPSIRTAWPIRYRSRKVDNPRHTQALHLAEAIEKVEKAKGIDRVGILIEMVRDATLEVSGWAMTTLGASDSAEARKHLDALAEKPDATLPIAAQVALDTALAKRSDADWQQSKQRLTTLRSWVAAKRDEHEAMAILQRLIKAYQNQEVRDTAAVELFIAAVGNREWPWAARRHAIHFGIGGIAHSGVDNDAAVAAYEWLFDRIRKSDELQVRRAAADSLWAFVILFPPQIKAIEEYLPKETDKEVKATLEAAVTKAKAMK